MFQDGESRDPNGSETGKNLEYQVDNPKIPSGVTRDFFAETDFNRSQFNKRLYILTHVCFYYFINTYIMIGNTKNLCRLHFADCSPDRIHVLSKIFL